jgi:hypothetical protein
MFAWQSPWEGSLLPFRFSLIYRRCQKAPEYGAEGENGQGNNNRSIRNRRSPVEHKDESGDPGAAAKQPQRESDHSRLPVSWRLNRDERAKAYEDSPNYSQDD